MAAPCQQHPTDTLGKMKLSVVLVALAIALTFQVRSARSKSTKNIVSINLQTNGADAIFWQFIRPFFNGQKPGFLTVATGSSNGTTSSGGTNQSAQGLNNSNAIFATNSNVSANISQTFNQPADAGQDSSSATEATTTAATSTATSTPTPSPSPAPGGR